MQTIHYNISDKKAVVIDMLTKATTVKAVKDAMIEYIAD